MRFFDRFHFTIFLFRVKKKTQRNRIQIPLIHIEKFRSATTKLKYVFIMAQFSSLILLYIAFTIVFLFSCCHQIATLNWLINFTSGSLLSLRRFYSFTFIFILFMAIENNEAQRAHWRWEVDDNEQQHVCELKRTKKRKAVTLSSAASSMTSLELFRILNYSMCGLSEKKTLWKSPSSFTAKEIARTIN